MSRESCTVCRVELSNPRLRGRKRLAEHASSVRLGVELSNPRLRGRKLGLLVSDPITAAVELSNPRLRGRKLLGGTIIVREGMSRTI